MELILLPGVKYFTANRSVTSSQSTDDTKSVDDKSKTLDRFYSSDIFDRNVLSIINDYWGMLWKTSSRCISNELIEIWYMNARYEVKVEIRVLDGRSDDHHKMVIWVFERAYMRGSRHEYGLYTNSWMGTRPPFNLLDLLPGNYKRLGYYAMRMMHDMSSEMLKVYCKPAEINNNTASRVCSTA